MTIRELPLFPLQSVLFPGTSPPLHIFEQRYREMVGRCLEDGSPFGVVLIKGGGELGEPAVPIRSRHDRADSRYDGAGGRPNKHRHPR